MRYKWFINIHSNDLNWFYDFKTNSIHFAPRYEKITLEQDVKHCIEYDLENKQLKLLNCINYRELMDIIL